MPNKTLFQVLDVVRQSCPVVIVDLPHVWSAWAKQVLVAADEVVLVTSPDLAGLRNTKNLADLLVLARPNDAPPRIVSIWFPDWPVTAAGFGADVPAAVMGANRVIARTA